MIILSDNDVVHSLIRQFYWCCLDYKLQPAEIQEITWSKQEEFLNNTVKNYLLQKYPMRCEYVRLFLKKLIGYLELKQEVHDDLYIYLCRTGNDNIKSQYRHYIIGNDLNNIVTLNETTNTVVNGTTGMRTWEASFIFTDWALCHKEEFKNKTVLELGSGVGFTGITISKYCQPKKFVLSDCHIDVLNTMKENLIINFPQWNENNKIQLKIDIKNIDWADVNTYPLDINPDVIIGADVVYDPCILKSLCSVIKFYTERNKNLDIYIAGVLRNEETFDLFKKSLECCNFQFKNVILNKNEYLHWNKDAQQYLIKIKKKP